MLLEPQYQCQDAEIDALSGVDAMSLMLKSHIAALRSICSVKEELSKAAGLVAVTFEVGRTVHYAAAGSSGLMVLADASELPGTFGVSPDQINICMAGGIPVDGHIPGETEDDDAEGARVASSIAPGDAAIIVSASGTTPFALGFAETAAKRGAKVIGIVNVKGCALLRFSDVHIVLETAKEVVEGSTRLGAGTVQKAALNMISTQAGVLLGHVHKGMMVNLNPENNKLRRRATDIVSQISGVPEDEALQALQQVGFDTKHATLLAQGLTKDQAKDLLGKYQGRLEPCLREVANRAQISE